MQGIVSGAVKKKKGIVSGIAYDDEWMIA